MTAKLYENRRHAAEVLIPLLQHFARQSPVVLALPRGGVPVGFEIAKALGAPLDIVLVRKIGAPYQPELALAAVVDGPHPEIVVNEKVLRDLDVDEAYVERESRRLLEEIEGRRRRFLSGRPRARISGRTAILVDDGIATGATVRAALHATRRANPERVVLAVPVAPPDTIASLRAEADEVVCPYTPVPFGAIGYFYADFRQISDEEVIDLLKRSAPVDESSTSMTTESR